MNLKSKLTQLLLLNAIVLQAQTSDVKKQVYTWKTPPLIGAYMGVNIYNGGLSGLHYIKGSNLEFYAVTDRGPNLDAGSCKKAIQLAGAKNNAKLFPLPAYTPQILHFKAQGDSLVFLGSILLKKPDGTNTSGIINPTGAGNTGELAFTDTSGTRATPDTWGIDSEGIVQDNKGDFFICEEYGASIWKTDKNGKLVNRYTPYGSTGNVQKEDIAIDSILKHRNPNKGFEGIAVTPNGKIYAFIQNPIMFPNSDGANIKKNSRLHRFVEIDPITKSTKMYGYQHDPVPANGVLSTIKNDKRYIGDAVGINNNEILVLEHGKSATESYAKLYVIDLKSATPIDANNDIAYGGKSFEQLLDSANANTYGVNVVKKTLFLDLIANGYDRSIEKQEGLTIINDTAVAIANDNDYSVESIKEDGVIVDSGIKSTICIFTVPKSMKLNYSNSK